ncbi:DNA-directed RNA polymerase subunit omega [bacterium]|nr:DNA-directed RNA polymerase subunit omega [bacterium]
MNENLKFIDKFDKEKNIYEMITKLAKRAHDLINGAPPAVDTKENDPIYIAMEEVLMREGLRKNE